jgi:tetratricopeptide (TPR) repeat protein
MERIAELIQHPEYLDRDTLYELRSTLALYPYYQTARLLMLQNLYLLHDPSFDEELRRAAIYITDRRVLFNMIEAAHYRIRKNTQLDSAALQRKEQSARPEETFSSERTVKSQEPTVTSQSTPSRTATLIDNFLDSLPKEESQQKSMRKPTPADAAVDYVAYLLETGGDEAEAFVPDMKGQELIDTFINADKGRIVLNEGPLLTPQTEKVEETPEDVVGEEYFTETLARIYIKQGRYSKALEIIQRLSLQFPKKNAYFADQIRFLEKLIINNNKK